MQRGTGFGCSDANLEIRWFMNRQFRLALLHGWEKSSPETVIDFTRYDRPAREPQDLGRNWSLLGRINQKHPSARPALLPGGLAGRRPRLDPVGTSRAGRLNESRPIAKSLRNRPFPCHTIKNMSLSTT